MKTRSRLLNRHRLIAVGSSALLGIDGIDTGIKDGNGQPIISGARVKVCWQEDIGITELDLEATGVVKYMADGLTAAFFVEFDKPIHMGVCEDGHYRCERQMLIQANDDCCINFTVLDDVREKTPNDKGQIPREAGLDAAPC
jgi:hypothetical protein